MISGKKVYALIPARGGSKRLPKKNILPLCGKPLIFYAIDNALKSKYIDRVIVTTDCEDIAEVARKYNAEVPFMRPDEISTSEAMSDTYIVHALEYFESENQVPDIIVLLQPTSPLREADDVDRSLELLLEKGARCINSVYKSDKSPLWYRSLDENGKAESYVPKAKIYDSLRDTTNLYLLNGAIYAFYSDDYLNNKKELEEETYAYVMNQEKSVDIDTEIDFKLVELLLKRKKN